MANEVNAGGVTFPAHGLGRPFRAIRAFENSPAIYGRVTVRQNQLSPVRDERTPWGTGCAMREENENMRLCGTEPIPF
jgi:hypothetical protein